MLRIVPSCKIIGELQLNRILSEEENNFFQNITNTRRIKHNTDYLWLSLQWTVWQSFCNKSSRCVWNGGYFFCQAG